MSTVEIEIDGKKLAVASGSMIIEAADAADIRIPRFCYHKKLSVAANCRMCLVEVEKVGKPLPACATPVTPGMKIFTQSAKAIDAQKSVMEFLLINHPLDCPICDQGGACELQDISVGYGKDYSRYEETKRSVEDENLGSLIATDMTRCIQCTRCVRFGQEIAGIRELGIIGRGDRLEIGTFLKHHGMHSELSGNVIDLCPVGALTSKPFRFKARAWELDQHPSIAPHDCMGSNIFLQTRRGKVMRVVPRENEHINETWLADRDRFSYEGLYSSDRLSMPLIKLAGSWQETDWATALNFAITQLKQIKETYGTHEIAGLAAANSTLEEFYLFQKLLRGIGCSNIDHRLHQTDVSDQNAMSLFPSLGLPIAELQEQELIIIVGSHLNHEQPLLAHRVREAYLQGAKILCINPLDFEFAFEVTEKSIVAPQSIPQVLNTIAHEDFWKTYFTTASKKIILLGALALNHSEASTIRSLVQTIADKYQVNIGYLTEGANSAGAWVAGCIPHRGPAGEALIPPGQSSHAVLQAKLHAYVLLNVEPDMDCANPAQATSALQQAEYVIAFSPYRAQSLLDNANVIFPIAPYAETSGTYINTEGQWQSFNAVSPAFGEARPAWKVLRVMGNLLQLPDFNYVTSEEIRDEIKHLINTMPVRAPVKFAVVKTLETIPLLLQRITEWPIYRGDMIVRRGRALQVSPISEPVCLRLNQVTAAKFALTDGGHAKVQQENTEIILPVKLDSCVPDNCVVVNTAYPETAELGESFGAIQITPCTAPLHQNEAQQ